MTKICNSFGRGLRQAFTKLSFQVVGKLLLYSYEGGRLIVDNNFNIFVVAKKLSRGPA